MSSRPSRLAALVAGALLVLPCGGVFAASQLFKCIDNGRTVYQQQACSVSSQPEAAASAARAGTKTAGPVDDAASAASRRIKTSLPASAALATHR